MKIIFSFILTISFLTPSWPQYLVKIISVEICNCIDSIENMDSLEAKLDRCFPQSVDAVFELLDEDTQELYSDEAAMEKVIDDVYEKLLSYCPKIKTFILEDKKRQFYRLSDSEKAVNYYKAGAEALESDNYKSAIKNFLKAIKADPVWVYPYDDLGLVYRLAGKYKKAVKYYDKSLNIYPEGSFALQNQAVAYEYLGLYDRAQENFNMLIYFYPGNPEGFFGTARVFFLKKEYENALDYAFFSHKMYLAAESEYIRDSRELISLIYDKLREQAKETLFFEKAKQFGINIIQNQTP